MVEPSCCPAASNLETALVPPSFQEEEPLRDFCCGHTVSGGTAETGPTRRRWGLDSGSASQAVWVGGEAQPGAHSPRCTAA